MSSKDRLMLEEEQTLKESIVQQTESAISATGVSKCYYLYDKPQDRLKQAMFPHLHRLLGMPIRNYGREFWALKDVSFEVKKGETVGIIGRNGSGKSTLLQIIAGTLNATQGGVNVNGRVAALLELGSGFNPEFTGRENVYMSAAIQGLSKSETDAKFDDIAAFADIGEFLEQPIKTYSSGMLMRLAFAVNTCIEPDILVVDEALGVGDAPFQSKCYKRLRRLVESGKSVLFVSHDISTVRSICSRALWLKDGRAELWGDAKTVSKEYERFCWQEQGVVLKISDHCSYNATEVLGVEESRYFEVTCDDTTVPSVVFDFNTKFEQNRLSTRMGTGAVVIRNMLLLNETGQATTMCDYDEQIKVYALLELCESVDSQFVLAVRFRDLKGTFVYSVNDLEMVHNMKGAKGDRFVAWFSLKLPLHHQQYVMSTAIFGFKSGNAYVHGSYDFSQAVIWDGVEDAAYLTVNQYKMMPLAGPVHVSAKLHLQKLGRS
jgi:lipopolysaccharide transport system ATP-binding protein